MGRPWFHKNKQVSPGGIWIRVSVYNCTDGMGQRREHGKGAGQVKGSYKRQFVGLGVSWS